MDKNKKGGKKGIGLKLKNFFTVRKIVLVLVVAAVIIGIIFFVRRKNNVEYDIGEVQKGSINQELVLSGEITAVEYASLYFPTSGKIAWVNVKEGDWVKRGVGLSGLNKETLDAAYQQARANLRKYDATVDYVHDSLKDKEDSETYAERDTRTTAEATKDYYWDALRIAEYNLKNANLLAPFEGLVTYVAHPYSGVNVSAAEKQVEMVNPQTLYFEVGADQSEVSQISLGQKVIILLDSFSDEPLEGVVSFVGYTPMASEVGAVYEVKVDLPQSVKDDYKYKVGMTGDAKFILSTEKDTYFVPVGFINTDTKGKYLLLEGNKKLYVETGIENEDYVEVKGEVNEGQKVLD